MSRLYQRVALHRTSPKLPNVAPSQTWFSLLGFEFNFNPGYPLTYLCSTHAQRAEGASNQLLIELVESTVSEEAVSSSKLEAELRMLCSHK